MSKTERWRLVMDVISTLALVIACVALVWRPDGFRQGIGGEVGQAAGPVETVSIQTTLPAVVEGAVSAPLALIEFADFECPFCAQFARQAYPSIKRDFIDTGKLRFGFRHYPLQSIHPNAMKASVALECAGQQRQYWRMHERLFQEPQQITEFFLGQHAKQLGLNESAFADCLETVPAAIKQDQDEAQKLAVRSTPTFLLGTVQPDGGFDVVKRIQGAVPYEVFKTTIESISVR